MKVARRSSAREMFERKRQILDLVSIAGFGDIAELARKLGVSDETVRRDVRHMLASGVLKKVSGGMVVPDILREAGFHYRLNENARVKEALGQAVAATIQSGTSMVLTAGSTITYFAHALRTHKNLVVATTSVDVARILGPIPGNIVFLPGGQVRNADGSVYGGAVERTIREHHTEVAIVSIEAITSDGLMTNDIFDAEIVRAAADSAKSVIVIAESAKFNRVANVRALSFDRVSRLVSDAAPPSAIADRLSAAGTHVEIVQVSPLIE